MKKLKKFVFKLYFDIKTGAPIGYNSRTGCLNCNVRKRAGLDVEMCPPPIQQLVIADLDKELPPLIGKPKHVIEAHAEVFIYEPEKGGGK